MTVEARFPPAAVTAHDLEAASHLEAEASAIHGAAVRAALAGKHAEAGRLLELYHARLQRARALRSLPTG